MTDASAIETIADVRAALAGGGSAVDVCTIFLERIQERDAVDARGADDPSQPLAGVPIAIKDNICTRGLPTTAASRILTDYRPPYDATVVERLRAAGAVILGKTNCDEFAMGSTTEHSCYGITRNPWDPDRVPGGSSGGSAAAVLEGTTPQPFLPRSEAWCSTFEAKRASASAHCVMAPPTPGPRKAISFLAPSVSPDRAA